MYCLISLPFVVSQSHLLPMYCFMSFICFCCVSAVSSPNLSEKGLFAVSQQLPPVFLLFCYLAPIAVAPTVFLMSSRFSLFLSASLCACHYCFSCSLLGFAYVSSSFLFLCLCASTVSSKQLSVKTDGLESAPGSRGDVSPP